MPTQKKIELVEILSQELSKCTVTVATNFTGMSVKEMAELRNHLSQHGIQYRVIKNTLAQRAGEAIGQPAIGDILDGPTGFALGYDDPLTPIKLLVEYLKTKRVSLQINGVLLDGIAFKGAAAHNLANIPSRAQLSSQLVGQLVSPLSRLVTVLNSPLQGLSNSLNGPLIGLIMVLKQQSLQKKDRKFTKGVDLG